MYTILSHCSDGGKNGHQHHRRNGKRSTIVLLIRVLQSSEKSISRQVLHYRLTERRWKNPHGDRNIADKVCRKLRPREPTLLTERTFTRLIRICTHSAMPWRQRNTRNLSQPFTDLCYAKKSMEWGRSQIATGLCHARITTSNLKTVVHHWQTKTAFL